jgi:hypothetical protein
MRKPFQLRLRQKTVAQLDSSQFVKDHGGMFSRYCAALPAPTALFEAYFIPAYYVPRTAK